MKPPEHGRKYPLTETLTTPFEGWLELRKHIGERDQITTGVTRTEIPMRTETTRIEKWLL